MGTLLDKPVTEKEDTEEGEAHGLRYGVSSMQGWRVDMEDSHCYEPNLDEDLPGETTIEGERYDEERC